MTDHSATIRTMNGTPAKGETTADVLASIRRLIAQDETSLRRDDPPLRRAQHDAPADGPAMPHGEATENRPLRLRQDALIPPAETRTEPRERRLRLATAEGGAVLDDTNRMAQIIRAATARDNETTRRTHAEPVPPEQNAAPAAHHDIPPRTDEPAMHKAQPITPTVFPLPEVAAIAPSVPEPDVTAAAQMAQADVGSRRPTDDVGDSTALHLFAPADEDIPNGTILRSLLREAIRQELQGEMGGRFSRNLRRVIRQEVSCAIDEAMARREQGDKPAAST